MKALIYYSKLNTGGAERSNVRLMKKLAESGWDVTLLLKYGGGTLESEVPKEVRKLYLRKSNAFVKKISGKSVAGKIKGYLEYLNAKRHENQIAEQIKKESFDIAIVGLQGLDAEFIVKNVNAKKRLLWIRNDLSACDPNGRVAANIRKHQNSIDYFPCVSQTALDSFCEAFPDLKDKAVLFYNIIDAEAMIKASGEPSCIDGLYTDAPKVLSVCRIADRAKGVFRMLDIYDKLRGEGIFFYWLLAGNGDDYEELSRRVKEKKLQDGFILLGHQQNPFPLYKQADIVAVLSYYEGLCGIVNEGKVMGKPIVATEFSGIHEQIVSGDGGIIVENSFEGAYEGLKKLLTDADLRSRLTNNHLAEQIISDDYKLKLLEKIAEENGEGLQ